MAEMDRWGLSVFVSVCVSVYLQAGAKRFELVVKERRVVGVG